MKQTLFLLLVLTAFALRAQEPMQYRIVPVGSSQWMNPELSDEVREQIDRIAADGYNVISVGTFTFLPMHIVDYADSPYPEAAEYTPEKVARNLAALRKNISYAKSRGIRYVVTRSYSHYAPYKFWCAHQQELNPDGVFDRLLRKAHQNDMFQKALAGKSPNCVPQQQWTNDLFRDFFLWSTSRALDLLPELDGFLNAYAEAAWTYDIEKVRSDTWESWKECVDYDKTDSCFVDYSNDLSSIERAENVRFLFEEALVAVHPLTLQTMIVAYLRVSTEKQTLANQQNEISKFADSRNLHVDRWVTEIVSGKKKGRERKLGTLLRRMKRGDTMIVTELSRLSRTLTDIMAIVGELLKKEVCLYSTKDHYAFDDTINSKVLCFAFGLVAEIERNLISMRTREALALRREQGIVLGRRKGSYTKLQQLIDDRREIVSMMNRGHSVAAICRQYGVARNTFDRFRKQYIYSIMRGQRKRWRVNGNVAEPKEKTITDHTETVEL